MDIFFADPSEVPLPPEEVRIRELKAKIWPDERRVTVYLEVDPSQQKPNAELKISDQAGREYASASIIESMTRKMEVTLHLRGQIDPGEYLVKAELYFAQVEQEPGPQGELQPIERNTVDQAHTSFMISSNNLVSE